MQEMKVRSLDQEDPLEKEMTTHSGILAWEITWRGSFVGVATIGQDKATKQHISHHSM